MANPNADIYLTPENWIPCKVLSGKEEGSTGRPKIVNWADNTSEIRTGTLGYGAYMQKLVFSEPIDKTICPTGQHPSVSIFSEIQEFKNTQNNSTIATPVSVIEHKNAPCNWFIGEETGLLATQFGMLRDRGNANQRWSPNPANDNGANANVNIAPYTTWGIDGMLLRIEVLPVIEWENIGGVTFPKTYSLQWRTLREWKENYSNYPICCIGFVFYGQSSKSGTTLMFADNSWIYNESQSITACPLDDLGEYSDEPFYDYAQCAINRTHGFYLMNSYVTEPYNNTSSSAYCYGLDHFDGVQIHAISDSTNGWRHCVEIPYSEKNFETIYKMAACFGMCFTDTNKYIFPADYNDDDLFIPVIDENGISNGEYTHGADNVTNPMSQISDIRSINYDPTVPFDPNTYSDTTSWNNVAFINAFTKRYILTSSMVGQLSSELWAAQSSKPADIDFQNFAVDEYLTNNPIDTIVSLKYFPCTFDDIAPTTVYLGKYQTSIAGAIGLGTSVRVIDFAPIEVYRHFGDFRDFEPYTQLSMYIPFCGTVSIPTAECMGNYVSVKLCIDVGTGAATGYVIVSKTGTGGICVATATGTAAIDIPVSGLQSANLSQAVFNAAAQWTQTQISNFKVSNGLFSQVANLTGNSRLQTMAKGFGQTVKASAPTTLGGLLNTALSLDPTNAYAAGQSLEVDNLKADYNLSHIEMPMRLIGSISPALSSVIESNCRLIIYRPITDESALTNYGNTVGYATLKGGTVGQFSGFTVGTIDVSGINATAKEKQAIAAAFANGVYL